jgi:hypothetical protein
MRVAIVCMAVACGHEARAGACGELMRIRAVGLALAFSDDYLLFMDEYQSVVSWGIW